MRFLLFLCAALLALAFCIRPALALKGALTIEGTEFVLSLDDGRRLRERNSSVSPSPSSMAAKASLSELMGPTGRRLPAAK
jgi:hypothetical protein